MGPGGRLTEGGVPLTQVVRSARCVVTEAKQSKGKKAAKPKVAACNFSKLKRDALLAAEVPGADAPTKVAASYRSALWRLA